MLRKKRYAKYIPFAWLFGNLDYINRIDPFLQAESNFYSSLFGRLYEIITQSYEKLTNENIRSRILKFYKELIERVESEFKKELSITQADEAVFQQLLTKYMFFLYPRAVLIESQPMLTSREKVLRRPDFHIQPTESEHIYVEIEPPFCKPFYGSTPSSRLREALNQIAEWKEILTEQTAGERGIHYMIIIGRLNDLNKEEKDALQDFNKNQENLRVVTWNWILKNVDKIKCEVMSALS